MLDLVGILIVRIAGYRLRPARQFGYQAETPDPFPTGVRSQFVLAGIVPFGGLGGRRHLVGVDERAQVRV